MGRTRRVKRRPCAMGWRRFIPTFISPLTVFSLHNSHFCTCGASINQHPCYLSARFLSLTPLSFHRYARNNIQVLKCVWGPPENRDRGGEESGLSIGNIVYRLGRIFQSSAGQVVTWALFVWLVLTGRAGFIFDTFLWAFALLTVLPVIAIVIVRWWISKSVIEGSCPSCGTRISGVKGQKFRCLGCGQIIKAESGGGFGINDPAKATVDVDAIDVDVID